MNGIGFTISTKKNEKRRAVIPQHLELLKIETKRSLFFEKDYGKSLGYSDHQYLEQGVNIAPLELVLSQRIICDAKIGDADYLAKLNNQTVFGWLHAVLNSEVTNYLIKGKLTAYAWENMYLDGQHLFWHNNEVAGEAAVLQAYLNYGCLPRETKVAVLGRGNIARGAIRALNQLGADVMVYDRRMERRFRKEACRYDVIVNAILWDKTRKDHIIYRDDLKRLKQNAMIIDISCDRSGAIESSYPTSIDNPIYEEDGIVHYAVDHTPALFYKTASKGISEVVVGFLDDLVSGQECETLANARICRDGVIVCDEIKEYQGLI